MSEFDDLMKAGYDEAEVQIFHPSSVEGVPSVCSAAWQNIERGKTLASNAGFELESGGQLIIRKEQVPDPEALSGKVATRLHDQISRRIRGVQTNRVSVICELEPENR